MIKSIFFLTLTLFMSMSALAAKNWGIPEPKSKVSSYADVIEQYGQGYRKDKNSDSDKNQNGSQKSEQSNSMNYYNQIPKKTTTKK